MEHLQTLQDNGSTKKGQLSQTKVINLGFWGLLLILCFLELGLMTFWRGALGNPRSAIAYFGVQILIAVLPLLMVLPRFNPRWRPFHTLSRLKGMIILAICVGIGAILLRELYVGSPDFAKYSDVIPQVQHLSGRFLHFEYPYQVIKFDTYDMTPTYLPTHWLPYCLSELTHIDPRWVSFLVFALAWIYMLPLLLKSGISQWMSILLMIMPLMVVSAVKDHDPDTWRLTVELLIAGYYLFLGLSILGENVWFQRIALVLCLLSRFSLVFWLPIYAFVYYNKHGLKKTAYHAGVVALACAVLYVPFLIKDPHQFATAQTYYNNATVGEWSRGDHPYHLYNGLGLAQLYFERFQHDLMQGILAMRKTLFAVMAVIMLLSAGFYYKKKGQIDETLFLICALKLSLAFFYAFVQIPYSYLYLVPMMITIPVLMQTARLVYR